MRYLALLLCCFALPLGAHPHVFVDTGLKLVKNTTGHIIGVEVSWRYDALYSLLVLEDMGLDSDYDGVLTEPELERLNGFDLNWIEGFEGDLYIAAKGQNLSLGKPQNLGTSFDGGQILSRHYRSFDVDSDTLLLKAFDPTYYTSYSLSLRVDVPKGCEVSISKADIEAATKLATDAMGREADNPNADFPEIGEAFADEVMVKCAAGF